MMGKKFENSHSLILRTRKSREEKKGKIQILKIIILLNFSHTEDKRAGISKNHSVILYPIFTYTLVSRRKIM